MIRQKQASRDIQTCNQNSLWWSCWF